MLLTEKFFCFRNVVKSRTLKNEIVKVVKNIHLRPKNWMLLKNQIALSDSILTSSCILPMFVLLLLLPINHPHPSTPPTRSCHLSVKSLFFSSSQATDALRKLVSSLYWHFWQIKEKSFSFYCMQMKIPVFSKKVGLLLKKSKIEDFD